MGESDQPTRRCCDCGELTLGETDGERCSPCIVARAERFRANMREKMRDPKARAQLRNMAFVALGGMAESRREEAPTDGEKLVDILLLGVGDKDDPARNMAMGRVNARMYELAAEHFAPPPTSRWRRAVRWLRNRFRRE